METVPAGSDDYVHYIEKREKYTDEIMACDRRIAHAFLADKCISGGIVLCAMASLVGLPAQWRFLQITGALGAALIGAARCIWDVSGVVSGVSAERRRAEENVHVLDETWTLFNK